MLLTPVTSDRDFARSQLPPRVVPAIIEFLRAPYEINDETHPVTVIRIDGRADAYRR